MPYTAGVYVRQSFYQNRFYFDVSGVRVCCRLWKDYLSKVEETFY